MWYFLASWETGAFPFYPAEAVVQSCSVACNFIKKRPWRRCFPVNFVKFLRTPFLTEHLRWLLLILTYSYLSRGGFLFTYFKFWISWNQIKCNEIYLKLFSWNSLKEIFYSVSSPYDMKIYFHSIKNNFVFNKTYFHNSPFFIMSKHILIQLKQICIQQNIFSLYHFFFSSYQNICSFSQNKFVFIKKYFHHIYFFHSSKRYFYYMNFSWNTFLVSISSGSKITLRMANFAGQKR